jgi:hypothetical protein
LTERDVELVGWVGRWRAVLAAQVQARFGMGPVVAYRRLGALVDMGLLVHRRIFCGEPGVYLATNGGLAVADVCLPAARIDLATYRHDLVAVWAALAVEAELAGSRAAGLRVVGDREFRALVSRGAAARHVGLTGLGAGRGRGHIPDVAVMDGEGRMLAAVEVELSAKGRARVERIQATYARDRHLQSVVYVTDQPGVAASTLRAAHRAGASELVRVLRCQIVGQGARVSIEDGPLLAGFPLGGGSNA